MAIWKPRPTLNVFLGLLLLAASTSTTIHHRHTQGEVPHAHRFGLVLGSEAGAAFASARSGKVVDPGTVHTHRVILGIEVYDSGDTPDGPAAPGPLGPDETQFGFGVGIATARGTADSGATPAGGCCLPDLRTAVAFTAPVTPPVLALPVESPPRCTLSDRARGERTGVRRT